MYVVCLVGIVIELVCNVELLYVFCGVWFDFVFEVFWVDWIGMECILE